MSSPTKIVEKPALSSIFESSDANLLFKKSNVENDEESTENSSEIRNNELKRLLFDDEEDELVLYDDESENEIDQVTISERNYSALHMNLLEESKEAEEYEIDQEGDEEPIHHKRKSPSKKKRLQSNAAVNAFRRERDVELAQSEPLLMDELRFLFITCGLNERKPGVYIQAHTRVNKDDAVRLNNLLDESDDFELELVEIVDDEGVTENAQVSEDILHEDLLNAANSSSKVLNFEHKSEHSDEDSMNDAMDISIEQEEDGEASGTKNNLYKNLIEHDHESTSSGTQATHSSKNKQGLNFREMSYEDSLSEPDVASLPDDESSIVEEIASEHPSHEVTILERLRNIKGRGASILAMSLSAATRVSPTKDDDDLYESPKMKQNTRIIETHIEQTFQGADSSDEDIEESERKHQQKVLELLKMKRVEKSQEVSPLMIRRDKEDKNDHQEHYLSRKRKRVAEDAFAKRKELATKFSHRFQQQKSSSFTASISSSGGFFSSFKKKSTVMSIEKVNAKNSQSQSNDE